MVAKTNTKTQVMEYIYIFLAVRKAQIYMYTKHPLDGRTETETSQNFQVSLIEAVGAIIFSAVCIDSLT